MKNKHILFLLTVFALTSFGFTGCSGGKAGQKEITSANIDPENPPVMDFEDTLYKFGTISQGQTVKHTFVFVNNGKSDLVIQSVDGSCGCTIPKSWPKEPVGPGEKGEIEVNFNSESKEGKQRVRVTVLANTVPTKNVLHLWGNVVVPE
ncbi:MAG: DUF1573 domain-containing protein [Bacteroidota bacterium]